MADAQSRLDREGVNLCPEMTISAKVHVMFGRGGKMGKGEGGKVQYREYRIVWKIS